MTRKNPLQRVYFRSHYPRLQFPVLTESPAAMSNRSISLIERFRQINPCPWSVTAGV